jgi:hypothetical protein
MGDGELQFARCFTLRRDLPAAVGPELEAITIKLDLSGNLLPRNLPISGQKFPNCALTVQLIVLV